MAITIRIKKRKLRALKLLLAGCMIFVVLFLLDGRIRPLVETLAAYQAQLLTTRAVDDAVLAVLEEEHLTYSDLIHVTYGQDGEIASISTDMIVVNRIKSKINTVVTERLQVEAQNSVPIPVGTLLGGEYLSGRGPTVDFKVIPVGYAQADMYNDFQAAGINQTLHQVMLTISTDISAVLPIYTVTTKVNTNICIAQTVIVGDVPQAYTDINGDRSDLYGLYNDYRARLSSDTGSSPLAEIIPEL